MSIPVENATEESIKELQNESGEDKEISNEFKAQQAEKPEVWIRICPSLNAGFSINSTIYKIGDDSKKFQIQPEPEDMILPKQKEIRFMKKAATSFTFDSDGIILPTSSQPDTFKAIAKDIVKKVMDGINGMILTIGPKFSGKSYTLFGCGNKYESRGLIPRAMETIFEIIAAKRNEVSYVVRLGVIEVRKNAIRDLLAPGITELKRVVKTGPQGMRFQEIGCIEHGLGLLMLALSSQKLSRIHPCVKCHTIVYIDVQGENLFDSKLRTFKSRLTFVKIASLPHRPNSSTNSDVPNTNTGRYLLSGNRSATFFKKRFCVADIMSEAIELRKDLFLIEQMFLRSQQLHRLCKLYSKLKKLGMKMLMKKPQSIPTEFFHQCKLAHCIQDIVGREVDVRVIVNIRLDNDQLHPILEALRFGERAKRIPHKAKTEDHSDDPESLKKELALLLQELEMQESMNKSDLKTLPLRSSKVTRNRKRIYDAAAFLDGRLQEIEIINKRQVKAMFETFRAMWKYTAEQLENRKHRVESTPEPVQAEIGPPVPEKAADEPAVNSRPRGISSSSATNSKKRKPKSKQKSKNDPQRKKSQDDQNIQSNSQVDENAISDFDTENPQLSQDNARLMEDKHGSTSNEITMDEKEILDGEMKIIRNIDPSITKSKAWEEFINSTEGGKMADDIKKTMNILTEYALEYDQSLSKLKGVMAKLIQYLDEFNKIQEDKASKNGSGEIISIFNSNSHERDAYRDIRSLEKSRDDTLEKLNSLRAMVQAERSIIARKKNDSMVAFEEFSLNNFGVAFQPDQNSQDIFLSTNNHAATTLNLPMENNEKSLERQYYEMSDFAKKQAKRLLRSEIKKPTWKKY